MTSEFRMIYSLMVFNFSIDESDNYPIIFLYIKKWDLKTIISTIEGKL